MGDSIDTEARDEDGGGESHIEDREVIQRVAEALEGRQEGDVPSITLRTDESATPLPSRRRG